MGERHLALQTFDRLLALGFKERDELRLQAGLVLFRSGLLAPAHRYFDLAETARPDCPEVAACLGYVTHQLGSGGTAFFWLRRSLAVDPDSAEARIYLANMLYDRGESPAALAHFEKTEPEDHFDDLGLYRTIELKKTIYRLSDGDPEPAPSDRRYIVFLSSIDRKS